MLSNKIKGGFASLLTTVPSLKKREKQSTPHFLLSLSLFLFMKEWWVNARYPQSGTKRRHRGKSI